MYKWIQLAISPFAQATFKSFQKEINQFLPSREFPEVPYIGHQIVEKNRENIFFR